MDATCKIRPCGWGVNYPDFIKLGKTAGLDFDKFVLNRFNKVTINKREFKSDIALIDKPSLLHELIGKEEPIYTPPDISKYDRIIDATGIGAYLPPRPPGIVLEAHQVRCIDGDHKSMQGFTNWSNEIAYIFPIGDGTVHIGYGLINKSYRPPDEIMKLMNGTKIICQCNATLWYSGPILPVIHDNVIGVGESIGLVDPMSGMGIIPAMDSARALAEYWYKPDRYEHYIERKYKYMARLTKARDKGAFVQRFFNVALAYRDECYLLGIKPGLKILLNTHRLVK